jgi:hypothetical protein
MWFKKVKTGLNVDVRPMVQGSYSFEIPRGEEAVGRSRHPDEGHARSDQAVLEVRLGIAGMPLPVGVKQALADFVVHHHSNIRWYDKAITREERWRLWFFACNMAMLAVIPVATWGITYVSDWLGYGGSTTTVEAISAVLASLFGVQRALTAWLDKRQLAAVYSKTRAKLKTALYTFEQSWRHRVNPATLDSFGNALETATDLARAAVDDEQDQHFEIAAAPTFSLEDLLSGATGSAHALTEQLAAKETADQQERRDAEKDAREQEALVQQFQRLVATKRDALNRLGEGEPDKKKALMDEINDASARQREAEIDRAIAMAKLNADAA